MVVYKFGGALARSRRGLLALVKLLQEAQKREAVRMRRADRSRSGKNSSAEINGVVLVVSAIGHTTRNLARAAELAEDGKLREAEEVLDKSIVQHEQLAESLGLNDAGLFDRLTKLSRDIASLLEGVAIVRELSPRTRDAILASGESLATILIEALLKDHEIPVRLVEARNLIVTDENFGHAAPVLDETSRRVEKQIVPQLRRSYVVLTQGFVGSTRDSITTTMGSESSDLTATLLASVLSAEEVVIWKTVPGLYTADPELVKAPKLIRSLSFDEAEEMGRRGARILFPTFAHPIVQSNTKTLVRIATPFARTTGHTTISRELARPKQRSSGTGGLALAIEEHLVSMVVSASNLHAFGKHNIILQWQSEAEIRIVIRKEDKKVFLRDLEAAGHTAKESATVSAISLILSRPDFVPEAFSLIAKSMHNFRVYAILQAGRSLIVLVDDAEGIPALRKLHHDLFEN